MATWIPIQTWRSSKFEGPIDTVVTSRSTASGMLEELQRHTLSGWVGAGGDAARKRLTDIQYRLAHVIDSAETMAMAFGKAQDGVAEVESMVLDAQALIDRYGFVVSADGSQLSDPHLAELQQRKAAESRLGSTIVLTPTDREIAARADAMNECADVINAAIDKVNEVETILGDSLNRIVELDEWDPNAPEYMDPWSHALFGPLIKAWPFDGLGLLPSPNEVAVWASMQDEETLLDLAVEHPELVGNMNGMPGYVRDVANRTHLDHELDDVESELKSVRDRIDGLSSTEKYNPYTWSGLSVDYQALLEREEELKSHQSELQALKEAAGPPRDQMSDREFSKHGRQLLVFSPATGADGHTRMHAAIAIGDVDTADNIAVNVPGTGTTVGGGIDNETARMEQLRSATSAQLKRAGRGDESVATVAWLGYDAPQNVVTEASRMSFAEDSGPRNKSFLEGIHYSRANGEHGDPRLVSMGHSYGSTAASVGANNADPGVIDAFVAYGTPGLAEGTLDVPEDERYVVQFDGDIINTANTVLPGDAVHGYHPQKDSTFQDVDPGEPKLDRDSYRLEPSTTPSVPPEVQAFDLASESLRYSTDTHSAYLLNQSNSQRQIANIVGGLDVTLR